MIAANKAETGNKSRKVTKHKGVTYESAEVAEKIKSGKLNEKQKSGVKLAEFLAAAGLNIHIFESTKDENGNYSNRFGSANGAYAGANGEIYIDLNAGDKGQGVMAYTISHEFTHFIQDWSAKKFKVFADALFESLGKSNVDVDTMVQEELKRARENPSYGGKTDAELYDIAYSEVVANSCETMLTDTEAVQKLAENIKANDKTLWQKICDFFSDLVDGLRNAYRDLSPDSPIAKEARKTIRKVEKLADLWAEAGADAISTYRAASENNNFSATGESTIMNENGDVEVKQATGDVESQFAQKNTAPEGEMRFSSRDLSRVPDDISDFVDNAVNNRSSNSEITISFASQWDNKAINRLGENWKGKYTGVERTITSRYVRHILNQHGNAFIEALRGQLHMDADAIKIALSNLKAGKGRVVSGTYSRRANPTITTEIPINGYTIYVEEPMDGLNGTSLDGRTAYLMPTSTTALIQKQGSANIPQRRSGIINSIDASSRIVNNILSDNNENPVSLYGVDVINKSYNAISTYGVYSMSTDIDAIQTVGKPVSADRYNAKIKNPYIVTATTPIITDDDIREGNIANRIAEIKRAGYDSIIMDYHTGDNYFVMVFDKNSFF